VYDSLKAHNNRIEGFDFIRAFAIFFVFLSHIIVKQSHDELILLIIRSISPGLTMSALGFISAYLLVSKYNVFDGNFYVKRFSRIYSSLLVCLFAITILHKALSYDVINQHLIIHYMGLSFFLDLLSIPNKSSIGIGLWFVTIINIMYLLLPLARVIYRHKYSKAHLFIIILLCMFLNKFMYNAGSAWNVVMAFNIGCYIGINSNIEIFTQKSLLYFLFTTLLLLLLSALATLKILPHEVRNFLLPLYPFFAIPLLFKIGSSLKGRTKIVVAWFSSISFEVYILHFYFINEAFSDLFPAIDSIFFKIFMAIIIVLPLSYIFAKIGIFFGKTINEYLLFEQKEVA
jgi:peptidoglycan/LPS O-acetylase OafA/YrhL